MDFSRAITHLKAADACLAAAIERFGPCTLTPTHADRFTALAESILYQQLSGKAAGAIVRRFKALFGNAWPTPAALLATPEARLRGAGVSSNKARSLKDLAQKTLDGTLDMPHMQSASDEEIIAHLTRVRGIGRWSVEMFLIFNLGRPDVFPTDDLGIQRGLQLLYGYKRLPAKRTMLRHAKPWAPYRSVASWYLWLIKDSDQNT